MATDYVTFGGQDQRKAAFKFATSTSRFIFCQFSWRWLLKTSTKWLVLAVWQQWVAIATFLIATNPHTASNKAQQLMWIIYHRSLPILRRRSKNRTNRTGETLLGFVIVPEAAMPRTQSPPIMLLLHFPSIHAELLHHLLPKNDVAGNEEQACAAHQSS